MQILSLKKDAVELCEFGRHQYIVSLWVYGNNSPSWGYWTHMGRLGWMDFKFNKGISGKGSGMIKTPKQEWHGPMGLFVLIGEKWKIKWSWILSVLLNQVVASLYTLVTQRERSVNILRSLHTRKKHFCELPWFILWNLKSNHINLEIIILVIHHEWIVKDRSPMDPLPTICQ